MLKLLTALAEAEEYLSAHPDAGQEMVQRRLGFSDSYLALIWPNHQFALSLDQLLLMAMADERRWTMENGLTTATESPAYREYVDTRWLYQVRPGAVNIR